MEKFIVFKTHFILLVDLRVSALLLLIYLSIYLFSVMVVHMMILVIQEVMTLDNTMTYHIVITSDYKKNYLVEIAYHQEEQGMGSLKKYVR